MMELMAEIDQEASAVPKLVLNESRKEKEALAAVDKEVLGAEGGHIFCVVFLNGRRMLIL